MCCAKNKTLTDAAAGCESKNQINHDYIDMFWCIYFDK